MARPRMGSDYSLGLDPWKGQLRPKVRRPLVEPRRAWNDVPASELRHSSGKDGAALSADKVYPTKTDPYAKGSAGGAAGRLGGVAKPGTEGAMRPVAEWARRKP
jgi:hypothetical protein